MELRSLDSTPKEAILDLSGLGISLDLQSEQQKAISTLLSRKDLLAVLPTSYGKSLIFQLFVRVKELMSNKPACVIVVCLLESIVQDQIFKAAWMGLTAIPFMDASLEDVESGKYQLIFASAEEILEKSFLDRLKNSNTPLHQNLTALIADEFHTVETWTGQRFVCFPSPNSKEFFTSKRLFVWSLFNTSIMKKAKQFPVKNELAFNWIVLHFCKCDQVQLIRGVCQFNRPC